MIDYQGIIDYYYPEAKVPELRHILLKHSEAVARKAVEIVDAHPEFGADRDFVFAAAMLHDIGIIRCDAPGIFCYGSEPYLKHGVIGAAMLTQAPLQLLPSWGEKGLLTTKSNTNSPSRGFCSPQTGKPKGVQRLLKMSQSDREGVGALARVCARHTGTGLPGLEPETWEEKIVCYADKFFSKTKLDREKTYEEARQSLMKFGEEGVRKFEEWHRLFAVHSSPPLAPPKGE